MEISPSIKDKLPQIQEYTIPASESNKFIKLLSIMEGIEKDPHGPSFKSKIEKLKKKICIYIPFL